MYTLDNAAEALGIKKWTVRRQMAQCGIVGNIIITDRRRLYLSESDMITLAGQFDQKTGKNKSKKANQQTDSSEEIASDEVKNSPDSLEKTMYSLYDAASFLGVSVETVKNCIVRYNLEKIMITTDRKRAHISRDDVRMLANRYKRKAAQEHVTNASTEEEENNTEENVGNKLYSVTEVASSFKVSTRAIKRWISKHNIEKIILATNRTRVYITHKDFLTLLDHHKSKISLNSYLISIPEDLKEIRSKLKSLASEIEDIKHDFNIFVKRSIYIG